MKDRNMLNKMLSTLFKSADFCYKSSVPGISKKLRFDIHIFNLNRCLLSVGNLQLLRHRVAEDL